MSYLHKTKADLLHRTLMRLPSLPALSTCIGPNLIFTMFCFPVSDAKMYDPLMRSRPSVEKFGDSKLMGIQSPLDTSYSSRKRGRAVGAQGSRLAYANHIRPLHVVPMDLTQHAELCWRLAPCPLRHGFCQSCAFPHIAQLQFCRLATGIIPQWPVRRQISISMGLPSRWEGLYLDSYQHKKSRR